MGEQTLAEEGVSSVVEIQCVRKGKAVLRGCVMESGESYIPSTIQLAESYRP